MNEKESSNYRVLNTASLKALMNRGLRNHFNRQLDRSALVNIDPQGVHVLKIVLPFHNSDFAPVAHHRCSVMIKVKGTDEPSEAMIDVEADQFDKLTKASDYLARVG